MTEDRENVRALFDALASGVRNPRALEINERDRAAFEDARERCERQLVEELPPVLVVAIVGGTGVGKSTLINGLAGAAIAESGEVRPTTTQIVVYHHRDVALGGLPSELTWGARFVAHEREELRFKVLVDTPDLDSFAREHRERTLELLKSAGLVLYVFSPEKYLEERIWSVLRAERQFSATAAVLNKADTLATDELDRVSSDLAERLAGAGLSSIRVFRTHAAKHVKSADHPGQAEPSRSGVDDLPDLRNFLERELREGDATRIVRENRRRTLSNLRETVTRLGPAEYGPRLEAFSAQVASRADAAGARLVEVIAPELAAVEAELAPLATLRQHERFRGPFRAWLGLTDFVTIGLAGLVDRLVGRPARGTADVVERIFKETRTGEVEGLLRTEERALQDELYAAGLPVARWREVAGGAEGPELLRGLAHAVRERFEARSALASGRGGAVVWTISAIGGLVPAAAIFGGLWLVVRDLFEGRYVGIGLGLHLIALVLLFFLALHAIVSVFLPTTGRLGKGLGLAAASEVLPQMFADWVDRYRADLEADMHALVTPLEALERLTVELSEGLATETSTADSGDTRLAASLAWPSSQTPTAESAQPGAATKDGPAVTAKGESSKSAPAVEIDPAERMLRALERD